MAQIRARPFQIKIREMRLSDLEQVICIEHEIFLFPWSIGNFSDSIKAGHHCQVMVQQQGAEPDTDLVMGYSILMIGPGEAHVLTLGVGYAWQNQGLGGAMLRYLIELSRKHRAEFILLDVRESNTGAANLYRRLGFQQIAVRKDYYPAMCGREDALIMRREL
ncbi:MULTISPECIES: ribosomal protein S18-alanine N-acetyltransferase [Nitrosomonas]|uniref:ribosomal protein S18-alanine N-acetyltransferase n=1 Tax=Nitrosomonas TaxID=914 RepID=UPI0008857F85|nr:MULTISPECIES: ribosomal protein S18-alanine N-acetyltransferase [Nitrosomonas]MXS79913.1 ribosomal-protein-alanine N-acetyltransferase [Nitrosomonas sp. GH22]SCX10382.1 [SSU ribosomal protein S18P]-alanine acetyltransferase [Nitrosomonas eutropha]SDW02732.1 [SSU ribosomal protein S18P]-alanine acetyltransferase [Nitrosomonas eutropha]SEI78164.1 [SSU ribosomal protein S18P]-alanine acetyltransferase [Nitrosomonas eutropha]